MNKENSTPQEWRRRILVQSGGKEIQVLQGVIEIMRNFGLTKPKTKHRMLVDQVLRYSKSYKDDIFLLNSLKRHLAKILN